MLANSWRLAGRLAWLDTTKQALPIALSFQFRSRLIRTDAKASGIPARWRRAGYLKVVSVVGVGGDELLNVTVPINTRKVFPMPRVTDFYQLIFQPVDYLPQGLQVWFYEYTGPEPDEKLFQELLLMQ